MSNTELSAGAQEPARIPATPVAVSAKEASMILGCGYSTFFKRVKAGIYPKAGPDGRWSVKAILSIHDGAQGA